MATSSPAPLRRRSSLPSRPCSVSYGKPGDPPSSPLVATASEPASDDHAGTVKDGGTPRSDPLELEDHDQGSVEDGGIATPTDQEPTPRPASALSSSAPSQYPRAASFSSHCPQIPSPTKKGRPSPRTIAPSSRTLPPLPAIPITYSARRPTTSSREYKLPHEYGDPPSPPSPASSLRRAGSVQDLPRSVSSPPSQAGLELSSVSSPAQRRLTKPHVLVSPWKTNLPDMDLVSSDSPTAYPIAKAQVQVDLDFSLRKLISFEVFTEMLKDPLGRHRFRGYLESVGRASLLDCWWDASNIETMVALFRDGSLAMHETYFTRGSTHEIPGLPSSMQLEMLSQLQQTQDAFSPFTKVQDKLLNSLYEDDFQTFLQRKLVESSQVRLGNFKGDLRDPDGAGDIFVLTNPRLRDHPIVMVSDGFCKMTGYSRESIVGRNCRFLQGPETSPASVQRMREALNEGRDHTELLLNYHRDGTPFWNLLAIIPLYSSSGSLIYFIGGQINVTGSISSSTKLSFLIGGEASSKSAQGMPKLEPMMFSPTLVNSARQALPSSSALPERSSSRQYSAAGSSDATLRGAGSIVSSVGSNGYGAFGQELGAGLGGRPKAPPSAPSIKLPPPKTGLGRLLSRLGGGGKKPPLDRIDQLLPGAENDLRVEAGPLATQIDYFSSSYTKVLVLRPQNHEIVFVTRQALHFLGLPYQSTRDLFSSCLIHLDLLELIDCVDRDTTKRTKSAIKLALRKGVPLSIPAGFRLLPESRWKQGSHDTALKNLVFHLTPVKDASGEVGSYIVIIA